MLDALVVVVHLISTCGRRWGRRAGLEPGPRAQACCWAPRARPVQSGKSAWHSGQLSPRPPAPAWRIPAGEGGSRGEKGVREGAVRRCGCACVRARTGRSSARPPRAAAQSPQPASSACGCHPQPPAHLPHHILVQVPDNLPRCGHPVGAPAVVGGVGALARLAPVVGDSTQRHLADRGCHRGLQSAGQREGAGGRGAEEVLRVFASLTGNTKTCAWQHT